MLFIINDYVDLCLEIDVDGIYVGGIDVFIVEVCKVVGLECIVGVLCYGMLELVYVVYCDGVSYVVFGGFYLLCVKKYDFWIVLEIIV